MEASYLVSRSLTSLTVAVSEKKNFNCERAKGRPTLRSISSSGTGVSLNSLTVSVLAFAPSSPSISVGSPGFGSLVGVGIGVAVGAAVGVIVGAGLGVGEVVGLVVEPPLLPPPPPQAHIWRQKL